jgi:hypothetical protein
MLDPLLQDIGALFQLVADVLTSLYVVVRLQRVLAELRPGAQDV